MFALLFISLLGFADGAKATAAEMEMVPTETLIVEAASKVKRGGGSSSIGADSYDARLYTAWFYGKDPIKTCYNSLGSFGVSNKVVETAILRSLQTWKDYFKNKVLLSDAKNTDADTLANLNFRFSGKCKGNEDLVLFFGAGPIFGNVQDLKMVQTLQSPLAYVNKTHMRRNLKWSKGYIRFISHGEYGEDFPNWKNSKSLEAILTHELGHILGFGHTPHTIMSADVIDQVSDGKEVNLSVDQAKQLVTCGSCREVYSLVPFEKATLLGSFGLDLKKNISLIKVGSSVTMTDGKREIDLLEPKISNSEMKQTLFTNFSTAGLNQGSQTMNIYGKMKNRQGQEVPVVIEYNSIDQKGGLAFRMVSANGFDDVLAFQR